MYVRECVDLSVSAARLPRQQSDEAMDIDDDDDDNVNYFFDCLHSALCSKNVFPSAWYHFDKHTVS